MSPYAGTKTSAGTARPHRGPRRADNGQTDGQTDGRALRFAAARALGYASPKTTSCARSPEGVFLSFPGAQWHAATAPAPSGGTSPLSPHGAESQLGRGQQGMYWWARGIRQAQSLWVCTMANPRDHPRGLCTMVNPRAHPRGLCTMANPSTHPGGFCIADNPSSCPWESAPRLIPALVLGDFSPSIIPARGLGVFHPG